MNNADVRPAFLQAKWHYLWSHLILWTLEVRKGDFNTLLSALPTRSLLCLGYAASPWLIGKFAEEIGLPLNFASHNREKAL